ncbi:hypothetical protein SEA_TYSON_58 [Mycobacterium phage Tyson]|nr:hypothetical protein SEA_TYSON_58 [Mycobacterium phage Tyson]
MNKPVGTVVIKRYPELGPDVFDAFVMTRRGWVLVDQTATRFYPNEAKPRLPDKNTVIFEG